MILELLTIVAVFIVGYEIGEKSLDVLFKIPPESKTHFILTWVAVIYSIVEILHRIYRFFQIRIAQGKGSESLEETIGKMVLDKGLFSNHFKPVRKPLLEEFIKTWYKTVNDREGIYSCVKSTRNPLFLFFFQSWLTENFLDGPSVFRSGYSTPGAVGYIRHLPYGVHQNRLIEWEDYLLFVVSTFKFINSLLKKGWKLIEMSIYLTYDEETMPFNEYFSAASRPGFEGFIYNGNTWYVEKNFRDYVECLNREILGLNFQNISIKKIFLFSNQDSYTSFKDTSSPSTHSASVCYFFHKSYESTIKWNLIPLDVDSSGRIRTVLRQEGFKSDFAFIRIKCSKGKLKKREFDFGIVYQQEKNSTTNAKKFYIKSLLEDEIQRTVNLFSSIIS